MSGTVPKDWSFICRISYHSLIVIRANASLHRETKIMRADATLKAATDPRLPAKSIELPISTVLL